MCGSGSVVCARLCTFYFSSFASMKREDHKRTCSKLIFLTATTPTQRSYFSRCVTNNHATASPQCSRNCEGGSKSREVTCVDMRDERPLRPFHCRAVSSRPQTHLPCNFQPCLDWYASSWGQVSDHQNDERSARMPDPWDHTFLFSYFAIKMFQIINSL